MTALLCVTHDKHFAEWFWAFAVYLWQTAKRVILVVMRSIHLRHEMFSK